MVQLPRRNLLAAGGGLALIGTAPGTAKAQAAWPVRPITFICGFGPGGSADRTARGIAQFLAPELGQPITVVNRPGAGGQVAAAFVRAQPDDGYTMLATAMSPYMQTSIIHTRAPYTLDDFAFVNAQWSDWELIAAKRDLGVDSLAALMASIRDNPGRHSVSVVPSSGGQLNVYILLDALRIPARNLRIVTYDSGAAARAAAAGGQVDFTILGGDGSAGIRELVRPLAVIHDRRVEGWEEVPTVNEALRPLNVEVPILSGSIRGLATRASFRTNHPDRWQKLVSAYEAALAKPEAQAHFRTNRIGADWVGPERTTQIMRQTFEIIERYKDVGR
ncbi:MAG TPA: tripartite tricarboxylate transporter substrate binding protein [Roseococcus sp.]|jgi:tripartite-type tricarboxylate transporter receptor subunit TctC|nr:tripartite tricarboxylate transporter substrate binding protein [Roseococcus sp.]